MIRVTGEDGECPVKLFEEDDEENIVRECQTGERDGFICRFQQIRVKSVGSSNEEGEGPGVVTVIGKPCRPGGRIILLSLAVEDNQVVAITEEFTDPIHFDPQGRLLVCIASEPFLADRLQGTIHIMCQTPVILLDQGKNRSLGWDSDRYNSDLHIGILAHSR